MAVIAANHPTAGWAAPRHESTVLGQFFVRMPPSPRSVPDTPAARPGPLPRCPAPSAPSTETPVAGAVLETGSRTTPATTTVSTPTRHPPRTGRLAHRLGRPVILLVGPPRRLPDPHAGPVGDPSCAPAAAAHAARPHHFKISAPAPDADQPILRDATSSGTPTHLRRQILAHHRLHQTRPPRPAHDGHQTAPAPPFYTPPSDFSWHARTTSARNRMGVVTGCRIENARGPLVRCLRSHRRRSEGTSCERRSGQKREWFSPPNPRPSTITRSDRQTQALGENVELIESSSPETTGVPARQCSPRETRRQYGVHRHCRRMAGQAVRGTQHDRSAARTRSRMSVRFGTFGAVQRGLPTERCRKRACEGKLSRQGRRGCRWHHRIGNRSRSPGGGRAGQRVRARRRDAAWAEWRLHARDATATTE